MKAQKPAEGISLTNEFATAKFYKVNCSCGNNDDEINFEVEIEDNQVIVHTWTTQKTDFWTAAFKTNYNIDNEALQALHFWWAGFANGFVGRLKLTWNLWFRGYLKYESWTIMSKQQALNYAETLNTAIKDLDAQIPKK